jgi:glutaredoxin-like protein NrdH
MTVIIYTTSACPGCTATKKHLDRIGVAYTEVAIDSDEGIRAAAAELGITSAPIVCVQVGNEGYCFGGYRPDRLNELRGAA